MSKVNNGNLGAFGTRFRFTVASIGAVVSRARRTTAPLPDAWRLADGRRTVAITHRRLEGRQDRTPSGARVHVVQDVLYFKNRNNNAIAIGEGQKCDILIYIYIWNNWNNRKNEVANV